MNNKELFTQACTYIPGGVNSPVRAFKGLDMPPLFFDCGQGALLTDTQGISYLDFCLSWGSLFLGHAHPVILDAVTATLKKGTSFGAPTTKETHLAKIICTTIPSVDLIRFVNSGTEAVMTALRLARAITGRETILKFDGCYHGHSDQMLVSAGSGVAELAGSFSGGICSETTKCTLSIPFNNLEILEKTLYENKDTLAAVILEPVPANMGLIIPIPGFLLAVRNLTQKYGIVLIFDEVITGFRLGLQGAQGRFNITPDITCFGKIIGGGFPVGAIGGRKDIMEQLAPLGNVYQAGTLSGNPVAMSAGIATLSYLIEHPDIYTTLENLVMEFALTWKTKSSLTINALGSMFTLFNTTEPVTDFASAQKQDFELFKSRFVSYLSRGVYTPPSMYETSFVSTCHTPKDMLKLLD